MTLIEISAGDHTFEVEYTTHGYYLPRTESEPESFPEFEIKKITLVTKWIPRRFRKEIKKIKDEVMEKIEDAVFDKVVTECKYE